MQNIHVAKISRFVICQLHVLLIAGPIHPWQPIIRRDVHRLLPQVGGAHGAVGPGRGHWRAQPGVEVEVAGGHGGSVTVGQGGGRHAGEMGGPATISVGELGGGPLVSWN